MKCSASLAFNLFSPTCLINSIKQEHSCKILYFSSVLSKFSCIISINTVDSEATLETLQILIRWFCNHLGKHSALKLMHEIHRNKTLPSDLTEKSTLCNSKVYTAKYSTVKPVLSGLSEIDKTKVLKPCVSLMQVESIAACSSWTCIKQ